MSTTTEQAPLTRTRSSVARSVLVAAALSGCGGEATPVVGVDGGPVVRSLSATNIVAYEGQEHFVTVIESDAETDLEGAVISARDSSSALRVVSSLCHRDRCGVVLEVLDLRPPLVRIPRPADSMNDFLRVRLRDGEERQVLIGVWPVDTVSNAGSDAAIQGTLFASSASSSPGGTFRGRMAGEPVRWLVFGSVDLEGDLDVAASLAGPGSGGSAGGLAGQAAAGATGGAAGTADSGAGGGGGAGSAGTPGEGPTAGPGGARSASPNCASDFEQASCGGGGGGGAVSGAGGAGAGSLMIAALGTVRIRGPIRATGAPGDAGGGGGGAGGMVHLAGSSVEVSGVVALNGGAGGGMSTGRAGGAGGLGIIRIDSSSSTVGTEVGSVSGVGVDVSGAALLVDAGAYMVRGVAQPGATVRVEALGNDAVSGEAIADSTGRFEVSLSLAPGLNRLRVVQRSAGGDLRGWNGTSFEFVRGDGLIPMPVGGLLDVAWVPAT